MSIKINLPQQNNIISIDDDCALLEEVTDSGYYVYKFKYFLDPTHWVFSKTGTKPSVVVVKLSNINSKTSKISMFKNEIVDFANNITQNVSMQKDLFKQQEIDTIFFTYNSDYTKSIPNNMTKDIKEQNVLSSNTKVIL